MLFCRLKRIESKFAVSCKNPVVWSDYDEFTGTIGITQVFKARGNGALTIERQTREDRQKSSSSGLTAGDYDHDGFWDLVSGRLIVKQFTIFRSNSLL